jgi:hypothetical protein
MAGHSHFTPSNVEEHFIFTSEARKKVIISLVVGIVLTLVGSFLAMKGIGEGHETAAHGTAAAGHGGHEVASHVEAAGHHAFHWTKRLWANIWMNSVFFAGIAVVGMFFVSLQYLAKAGWSSVLKRVPEAFPAFLPYVGLVMLITFALAGHDLFHWTDHSLYVKGGPNYDKILDGKKAFLNVPFFYVRLVIYFVGWYFLWTKIRKKSIEEDLVGGTSYFYDMVKIGTMFIVFFGITSSTSAWDWSMSIDSHWFSTMFGWYHFASWHVTGYAVIILTVLTLKDKGYMAYVNESHLHDLGKFLFGFSIFWTYVWFAQFLLIYYANLGEEAIYFLERWEGHGGIYRTPLTLAVLLNFFFPVLWLMTRDAKRSSMFMKVGACLVIIGHYFDFYQMHMPGVVGKHGGFGLLEFGVVITFASAFIYVVSNELTKASLVPKNHPFLEEALHHDI